MANIERINQFSILDSVLNLLKELKVFHRNKPVGDVIWKEIFNKELAHMTMEASKSKFVELISQFKSKDLKAVVDVGRADIPVSGCQTGRFLLIWWTVRLLF